MGIRFEDAHTRTRVALSRIETMLRWLSEDSFTYQVREPAQARASHEYDLAGITSDGERRVEMGARLVPPSAVGTTFFQDVRLRDFSASSKLLPVRTARRIYARHTEVVKVSFANNIDEVLINEKVDKSASAVLNETLSSYNLPEQEVSV